MTRRRLATLDDVPETGSKAFDVDGRSVLVCRSSAGVFAIENMCSHAYALLEGGKVKGPYIFCPLHGIRFNMRDGTPNGALTKKPIAVYETELIGDEIYADIPND